MEVTCRNVMVPDKLNVALNKICLTAGGHLGGARGRLCARSRLHGEEQVRVRAGL